MNRLQAAVDAQRSLKWRLILLIGKGNYCAEISAFVRSLNVSIEQITLKCAELSDPEREKPKTSM
jgi:hypothetical protein